MFQKLNKQGILNQKQEKLVLFIVNKTKISQKNE